MEVQVNDFEHKGNLWQRFWEDLKRKEFISLKILYFLTYGGMSSLFPFFTIHAVSLGITEKEYGSILGVLPLLAIFAPIVAGGVADKIGNFKVFLCGTLILSAFSSLLFLFVPPAQIDHQLPELVPTQIHCSTIGSSVEIVRPYYCIYSNISSSHTLNVTNCNLKCSDSQHDVNVDVSPLVCETTNGCDNNVTSFLDYYELRNISALQDLVIREANLTVLWKQEDDSEEPANSNNISISDNFCGQFENTLKKVDSLLYSDAKEEHIPSCWIVCAATTAKDQFCTNNVSVEELNRALTLSIYIIVRTINTITLVCSLPLFEGAVVAILQEYKGDFGFQKIFANLGLIIMTPIAGALIDSSSSLTDTKFQPAFYIYFTTKLICAVCILFVDLEFKKPAKKLMKEFKTLMKRIEVVTYIVVGFIAGVTIGIIDTYLFLLLEVLGGSKSMMGLTVTVGASCGIPMLFISSSIIKKIGHVNTMALGFSVLVIRLLGYSLITNPWLAMPFEALECFTTSLFGVAATSYASHVSSPSTVATLQGLFGGLMHGVGRGAGSMIGGFMISAIGLRSSFRVFAVVCSVVAAVYFAMNLFIFKKKEDKEKTTNHIEIADVNKPKNVLE